MILSRSKVEYSFIRCCIAFLVIGAVWFSSVIAVDAATLYTSPSSAKASEGNIVAVRVLVGTEGRSINNTEGTLAFPADLLEVVSVSRSKSIFSLWVEEPKFSNALGTVTFNGGIPNPGYTGDMGEVFSLVFRAKKQGTASLVFSDAAVRANDGLGTDILNTKGVASVEISKAPASIPLVADGTPLAPKITSTTHPIPTAWYKSPTVELQWDVPNDVTGVSITVDQRKDTIPVVVYDPPIANRKMTVAGDGSWYFHVRLRNKNGWGAITHYPVNVDTKPPENFKVTVVSGEVSDEPAPKLQFKATDKASGISHYLMVIDSSPSVRVETSSLIDDVLTLAPQDHGTHTIDIVAVDRAGNKTIATAKVTVVPLDAPQIKDYTAELVERAPLKIQGMSYPSAQIETIVTDGNGQSVTEVIASQPNGEFVIIWPHNLSKGRYSFVMRVIDDRGAKSAFTKALRVVVGKYSLFNLGSFTMNWLTLIVILILLIGNILFLVLYLVQRTRRIKKSVSDKVDMTEVSIHVAFNSLRDKVRQQIDMLEKTGIERGLTKEESRIMGQLQESLTKSEIDLERQVYDIKNNLS